MWPINWDTNILWWFSLVFGADTLAGVVLLYVEYRWFKPTDTRSMAKQIKKLIASNISKTEAKKVDKIIEKALIESEEKDGN